MPHVQESREKEDKQDTPKDAFLMVTQQHWEDKILWEVPYTPGPAVSGAGKLGTATLLCVCLL